MRVDDDINKYYNCRDKSKSPLNGQNTENNLSGWSWRCGWTKRKDLRGKHRSTLQKICYNHIFLHWNYKTIDITRNLRTTSGNSMKKSNKNPDVRWWVVKKKGKSERNRGSSCRLYQEEKLTIVLHPDRKQLLNKRWEIMSKFRHINKYTLGIYELGRMKIIFCILFL